MQTFTGWKREDIATIKAPTLIVAGDRDVMKPEHAVEMHHVIANSRLAIFPATHGSYMGEAMTADSKSQVPQLFAAMIEEFLAE